MNIFIAPYYLILNEWLLLSSSVFLLITFVWPLSQLSQSWVFFYDSSNTQFSIFKYSRFFIIIARVIKYFSIKFCKNFVSKFAWANHFQMPVLLYIWDNLWIFPLDLMTHNLLDFNVWWPFFWLVLWVKNQRLSKDVHFQ